MMINMDQSIEFGACNDKLIFELKLYRIIYIELTMALQTLDFFGSIIYKPLSNI